MQNVSPPPQEIHRADRPAWSAAKNVGNVGEQLVARLLTGIGFAVEQHRGAAPFDLTVAGKIEIKTDLKAAKTGNAAVETHYRGQPSGVRTSIAGAWVFVIGPEAFFVATARLRTLLAEGRYREVAAGEGATVCLVPLGDLRRVARTWTVRGGAA